MLPTVPALKLLQKFIITACIKARAPGDRADELGWQFF
jgi:hypothetical protein